ncbi:MAG: hypothetical protein AB7F67_07610 [Rhodospirillaceae bacterium]
MRRAGDITAPDRHRIGDVVAACGIAPDRLLLAGWQVEPFPAFGAAAAAGTFAAVSWRDTASADRHWFVAHVKADGLAAQLDEPLALRPAGGAPPLLARIPAPRSTPALFAAAVKEAAGANPAPARAMLDWAGREADAATLARLAAELLFAASRPSGIVEVRGVVPGAGYVVQGWAEWPLAGTVSFAIEDGGAWRDGPSATFERPDVTAPAAGFVAFVASPGAQRAADLGRICVRAGDRLGWLDIYAEGTVLRAEDTAGYLRGIKGSLRAPEAALRALGRTALSAYTGSETLTALDRPVRLAVDIAAAADGVGWYVSGWMADPLRRAAAVLLCRGDGATTRIDERWTRSPRPDVMAGLGDDPALAPHLAGARDRLGFTVFVPDADARRDRPAWLAVEIGDDAGYVPLAVEDIATMPARRRMLSRFDARAPGSDLLIERQLGPLFAAGLDVAATPAAAETLFVHGEPPRDIAVVVPCGETDVPLLRAFVAAFGLHPLPQGAALVIVVAAAAEDVPLRALADSIRLYDVPAAVLAAPDAAGPAAALDAAVAATDAPLVAVVAPQVCITDGRWLGALREALARAPGAAAACPTLLHEDEAIRYAGGDSAAGLPAAALAGGSVQPADQGTLRCCLATRTAIEAAGGFDRGLVGLDAAAADFFDRARARGGYCLWVSGARAYAPGEDGAGEPWLANGRLVDTWALAARRRASPAALR